MKLKILFCLAGLLIAFSGCNLLGTNDAATEKPSKNQYTDTATTPDKEKPKEEKEFSGTVAFPFDFPKVATSAKKGEHVLVPSYPWLVEAMQKDPKKVTMIWYNQKMEEPGDEVSKIKFMSETKEVPNQYIVSIPPRGTARKGDILLTWWQTGSGMKRAIVTDASDPRAPTVRYLDIDYDNPAKDSDKGTGIGQTDYQIKPDTFVVIQNEMDPGTTVAIGSEMKKGQVIRVAGDKVFALLFAGRVGVFPKSEVKTVPVQPILKAGDKVKVPFVGGFKSGAVTKVDKNIGRAWVKYDNLDKTAVVAFGDIMPN